ncbi:MAG: hypothetical protein UY50_C0017G0018 [Parcubacteria group bacterium GW2011_GWA2_49_9]|nr:MAG: hypothetical protein UY50_C0017G0018 [Parcubacteria group bacterium GW2011_GWA2_49_9]
MLFQTCDNHPHCGKMLEIAKGIYIIDGIFFFCSATCVRTFLSEQTHILKPYANLRGVSNDELIRRTLLQLELVSA